METDSEGNYQIAALPVGNYRVQVRARGFRTGILEQLRIEVARIVVQDFRLEVGDITQTINVTPEARLIETATVSVGFREAYAGSRTMDYMVGIIVLNLKKNKKGKEVGDGMLLYAAKIKIEKGKVDIEYVGMEPIRLANLRKY